MAEVGGCPLHAVPVVDLTLACLLVNVELETNIVGSVQVTGAFTHDWDDVFSRSYTGSRTGKP